ACELRKVVERAREGGKLASPRLCTCDTVGPVTTVHCEKSHVHTVPDNRAGVASAAGLQVDAITSALQAKKSRQGEINEAADHTVAGDPSVTFLHRLFRRTRLLIKAAVPVSSHRSGPQDGSWGH
ncbi:hypothetical protein BaRGS_00006501, partial [Batillaria attramentaria]